MLFARLPAVRFSLFTALLCLSSPLAAVAEENARGSVGLSLDVGTFDYRDLVLDAKIPLGPQYRLLLGAEHSKSESVGVSGRLRIGGDVKLSGLALVRAGLGVGNEPNDVKSAGASAGADFLLSSLWDGERRTEVSVDYSLVSYRQRVTPNIPTKRLAGRFRQQEWAISVGQELSESLSVDGFVSLYSYTGATGDDVNLAVDRRRARLANWESTVQGFAQRAFGFGMSYRIGAFTPGLSYSHSRVVFAAAKSDTLGAFLDYEHSEAWGISVRGARVKQEYEKPALLGGLTVSRRF